MAYVWIAAARGMIVGSMLLLCGCSLLGRDDGRPPATPPMIGAANGDEIDTPARRQKIRFASEVANSRAKAPRGSGGVAEAAASPGDNPLGAPSNIDTQLATNLPSAYSLPATPYPHTAWAFAAAPPPPFAFTQRLPDVRQTGGGESALH